MSIETFSEKYRVKARKDVDGTVIVPGKLGHIYEHGAGKLGVLFMPYAQRARLWSVTKVKGTAAGMTVRQNGDAEGTLLFDPANSEQARLALKLVRVKAKRVLSAAQRQALAERLKNLPSDALRNEGSAARNDEGQENGLRAA